MFQYLLQVAAQNPEGFTVAVPSLTQVLPGISAGIVVAYAETQDCFGDAGLEKALAHALANAGFVGGWFNEEDGQFYFDSVRIFPETDLETALEFGKANGQIAVFRLSDSRVIKL